MAEKRVLLNKAAILAAQDLPTADLEVPEWGGWVRVKSLSASERDAFENDVVKRNGQNVQVNARNIRAKLVAMTVVGEDGAPLFGFTDVEALGAKSAKALDKVFTKASELAGLRPTDVQELAENFS